MSSRDRFGASTLDAPRQEVVRDWLGRRLDLRECHRDPSCETHQDSLSPCSCRWAFRRWDVIVDWVLCGLFLGGILLFTLALATTFS